MPRLSLSLVLLFTLAGTACRRDAPPAPPAALPDRSPLSLKQLPTTDGAIATRNLDAAILSQEQLAARRSDARDCLRNLCGLLLSRGHYRGQPKDYQRARQLAEMLVQKYPKDLESYVARAEVLARLHRFPAA